MPNLIGPATRQEIKTEFVVSVSVDLLNSMCFTALAGRLEGLDGFPVQARRAMDPALRDELDFFFDYPGSEWGLLGSLTDVLFVRREAWAGIDALLDFIRDLPPGGDGTLEDLGIQGLVMFALRCAEIEELRGIPPRRDVVARAAGMAGRDAAGTLALFDNPEEIRSRLMRLIRRFYDEHYRPDEARRVDCMRRSADAHNARRVDDIEALLRQLTNRDISCIREEPGAYTHHIFVPSLDVGPYSSCADFPPYHGLVYRCEPEFAGEDREAADHQRMALIYRALADEQRLRILRLLGEGELYAQEIVARTGLHQSVVSRHLSFLKAVGLVNARRQNNMKFFSINTETRDEVLAALRSVLPPAGAGPRVEGRRVSVE